MFKLHKTLLPSALLSLALCIGGSGAAFAEDIQPADPDEIIAGDSVNGSSRIYQVSPSEDRIEVQVTLHKSESVRVGVPFSEALVGNAEVADVIPLTDRSIYIVGKQIGVTRLALLDKNKQMIGVVDVEVTYDLDSLRNRFRVHPGLDGVIVESVNGRILLTGTVPDAVAMQQALTLARQISPEDVTNAMKVASPQQVMLEVRFIEANRSASKALGVESSIFGSDVTSFTGVGSFSSEGGVVSNNLATGLVTSSVPFGSLVASIVAGNTNIDLFIKALEEKGLARRLAEPNLVALSGDTASFLAGGEFPFPASAKDNEITVEFKKFGVGLAFTPTVLSEGQINLKIEPEVSDLDPTRFIKVGDGVEIPSLVVRRASTTVELRDGQSFAIAGLLQSNHSRSQNQLPWLGDVPVIGALMRSAAWQKEETDLVIIITPRLVKPIPPGQKIASPLEKRIPTHEKEFFLTGQQEEDTQQPDAHLGHIIDWAPEESVEEGWKGTIQ